MKRLVLFAMLVGCLTPSFVPAQEDKDLKLEFDLLPEADQQRVKQLTEALEKGQFKLLEFGLDPSGSDLPVYFIRKHRKFFESGKTKAAVIKWAEAAGVKTFLANVGIDKDTGAEGLKFEFALLPPARDADGKVVAEGKQLAVKVSAKLKAEGAKSLTDDEKRFVQAHKALFFPPKQ